jgi:DNA-directed RNA polymerase specialized sigma24 family protein
MYVASERISNEEYVDGVRQIYGADSPQFRAGKLRFIDQLTYRKIAKVMDCAVSTAWAYVNDGADSTRRRAKYAEHKKQQYEAKLAVEGELRAVYTLLCDGYSIENTAKALGLPVERVQQIDDGDAAIPFRYTYDPRFGITRL